MNEVTTVAAVGEIRPTLADVVPGPGIVPGQCGVEEIRLLIDGLPELVHPGLQRFARDEPTLDDKSESLELFYQHTKRVTAGRWARLDIRPYDRSETE